MSKHLKKHAYFIILKALWGRNMPSKAFLIYRQAVIALLFLKVKSGKSEGHSTSPECLAGLGYINTTTTLPKLNSPGLSAESSWFRAPRHHSKHCQSCLKRGGGMSQSPPRCLCFPHLDFQQHCWSRCFFGKNQIYLPDCLRQVNMSGHFSQSHGIRQKCQLASLHSVSLYAYLHYFQEILSFALCPQSIVRLVHRL